MANVDKSILQAPAGNGKIPPGMPIEVEVAEQEPDTSGGAIIQFGESDEPEIPAETKHEDNLAIYMDATRLRVMGAELMRLYEADRLSRKDWERAYTEGLKYLGIKMEEQTTPWKGACGAVHPILAEAAVRFQAQAITEIFPAAGPCRTKIVGRVTPEKEAQAKRIEEDMNVLILDKIPDYRAEMERLLFNLALAGSAFKKIYFDKAFNRLCSVFVPAEDVVVAYGYTTLAACERFTHVMKKTQAEMRRLQVSGFYRGVELQTPTPRLEEVRDEKDRVSGQESTYETDTRHTILEIYVDLDLKEFPHPQGLFVPYVVSIEYSSGEVLAIRRNWKEGDADCKRIEHIVEYNYIPGLGFYGFGVIHLVGGIARSSTALLRQLVDAGTLSNLPGGLRAQGLRIKNEKDPIAPGEWRDANAPGDDLRKSLMPLPYKEPSAVLMALMNQMVDEGRKLASIAEVSITEMKQEAPVGTTLALLERAMKVMSGIQARLHASQAREFKILASLNVQAYPEYDIDFGVEPSVKSQDYDARIDVIPVSDPNAASMSQRIMQYTAAQQLAAQAPHIYDLPELHRQILDTLGVKNPEKVIPSVNQQMPKDPVTENQDIISGRPAKAFPEQDHEAHIKVHLAAIQDPKIQGLVGQSPASQAILAAAEAHVREHVGFQYRADIEKQMGVSLPPYGTPLPPEIEIDYAGAVAKAAEKLLAKDVAEQAAQEAAAKLQDPVVQQAERELDLKERDIARKERVDAAKIDQAQKTLKARTTIDVARVEAEREGDLRYLAGELAKAAIQAAVEQAKIDAGKAEQAAELGVRFSEKVMQHGAAARKGEKRDQGKGGATDK